MGNTKMLARTELIKLVNKTRKVNGKINYLAVARIIGRSHQAVKNWCIQQEIK